MYTKPVMTVQMYIYTISFDSTYDYKCKLDLQSAGSSPNLTYTKISAHDAIRILKRGWISTPPLDFDLETSHIFPRVLGLRVDSWDTSLKPYGTWLPSL